MFLSRLRSIIAWKWSAVVVAVPVGMAVDVFTKNRWWGYAAAVALATLQSHFGVDTRKARAIYAAVGTTVVLLCTALAIFAPHWPR